MLGWPINCFGKRATLVKKIPPSDGRGQFQRTREWVETATLEQLFDLWCWGHNLMGHAAMLLDATAAFRRIVKEGKP